MSSIEYVLAYLDTTAQLTEDPSFPTATAQSLPASTVAASLDVSASDFDNTFLFKTDDADVNDVSGSDIQYAIDYTGGVVNWPEIAIANATIDSGGTNTAGADAGTNNIKNDFIRFMAFKMLGTVVDKTDLFNNESALVADMVSRNAQIQTGIRDKLASSGTTASPLDNSSEGNANVVKHLLEQTFNAGEAGRFKDDFGSGPDSFTRFKFKSGDSLKIRVVYSPALDQPVSGLNAIGTQSYTITLNLN